MKKIITALALAAAFSMPAFALKKDNIEAGMHAKLDSVLVVLAKKTSTSAKGREIISMMDSLFDYNLMAKLALGQDTWNKITPVQKSEFTKAFITKLKQSYVEKLELYNNQKVAYKGIYPYQKGRLQLKTELTGKGETYKINYNFHDSEISDENSLTLGKVYDSGLVFFDPLLKKRGITYEDFMKKSDIIVVNDYGTLTWYERSILMPLDEWREIQLKEIGI
jgi:phospholipid transport system substrate-binding protein